MPNVMVALPNIGGALCSTPQFGWRPLLDCRRAVNVRCQGAIPAEIWRGCPKANPPIDLSRYWTDVHHCGHIWMTYCCLTSFFRLSMCLFGCEDIARQTCAMVPRWRFLATFLGPAALLPSRDIISSMLRGCIVISVMPTIFEVKSRPACHMKMHRKWQ